MMRVNNKIQPVSFRIRRVVEYGDFFVGEAPLDITATLKLYNRNMLVRIAAVLSLHYGNMCVPDNEKTLFSENSKKHMLYLNKLFKAYYNKLGLVEGKKVAILTYRTSLELWKRIFAIRAEEFTNEVAECDIELLLFLRGLAVLFGDPLRLMLHHHGRQRLLPML